METINEYFARMELHDNKHGNKDKKTTIHKEKISRGNKENWKKRHMKVMKYTTTCSRCGKVLKVKSVSNGFKPADNTICQACFNTYTENRRMIFILRGNAAWN